MKDCFLPLYPTKYYNQKVFSPIFNNISEKKCLDKPVFNNIQTDITILQRQSILLQTKSNILLYSFYFRPTNTLKNKMAPLSSIINHKHPPIYVPTGTPTQNPKLNCLF